MPQFRSRVFLPKTLDKRLLEQSPKEFELTLDSKPQLCYLIHMTTKITYAVQIKQPNGYWRTHEIVGNKPKAKRLFRHFVKNKIQVEIVEVFG